MILEKEFVFGGTENIVINEEDANSHHFLIFPQGYQEVVKIGIVYVEIAVSFL